MDYEIELLKVLRKISKWIKSTQNNEYIYIYESDNVIHWVVSDSATPWSVAQQAPLSVEFSRQEYWSGELFPSPGDLPNPGIKPRSPALQADSSLSEPPGKPLYTYTYHVFSIHSSTDRYLGYLCILAIVSSAGINMRVKISLQYSMLISFGYIPELGLLDHIAVLFLIFWKISFTLLSIVDALIYNSTNSAQGFPFLHVLINTHLLSP